MTAASIESILLSLRLAGITTVILLLVATPIAWWLSNTRHLLKGPVQAVVALPIVLPPTVLGFYFIAFLNPAAPLGALWVDVTGSSLTFSFTGLVIASLLYSLPFAVQPLQSAFETLGRQEFEAAQTLGASRFDAFVSVIVPLALPGFVSAAVLTFAHTLGEFGVVLMVGGNIPGETRTVSIAIYDYVETLDYAAAHTLSLVLLVAAFTILLATFVYNGRRRSAT
ncbi:MAG: molybdate ABC transporter permease subunit [Woeseiaceae bacterium]|nr:molybdate ABC transporter permease subunit [Woeseiaceae bacterium]